MQAEKREQRRGHPGESHHEKLFRLGARWDYATSLRTVIVALFLEAQAAPNGNGTRAVHVAGPGFSTEQW
jgi:hypothetical protein